LTEITCPLHSAAERFKNENALVCSGREFTYDEFNQLVSKTEQWLADQNIKRNDQVAILSRNSIEFPILLLALFRIGAVACPLNIRLPRSSILELLEEISVSHLICFEKSIPATHSSGISVISLDSLLNDIKDQSNKNPTTRLSSEQDATIIFTSGSMGHPKGVLNTLGNHYYNALGSNENIRIQPGDRWLVSLPFYHVGGLGILFRTILSGATIVIPDADESLDDAIIRYKISHCSLVPTQLYRLLQSDKLGEITKSLKALLIGGGSVPHNLLEKSIEAGLPVHTTYGLTELGSQVTTTPAVADIQLLKTSGKILKYRELKIADDGEILLKGDTLFKGYVTENKIKSSLDSDGWFHTGDMGTIKSKGYLTVSGRKDNMFISGGENIHPETIEAALLLLDSIKEAVVVGVNDPEFGKRPVVFIRSTIKINHNEIKESLRESLPGYMVPVAFYELSEDNKQGGIKYNRIKIIELAEKLYNSKTKSS